MALDVASLLGDRGHCVSVKLIQALRDYDVICHIIGPVSAT